MDLVLCHTTADFDTLGAAVGVTRLRPGSRIVLTGGAHPTVQNFLSLWRDEYPFIERRAVVFDQVRSLTLVDACQRDRFSPVDEWLQQAEQKGLPIHLYDHHTQRSDDGDRHDFLTAEVHIEAVGAVTTLIVEALQHKGLSPTPCEATVMALGIHSDTGSLTFEQATARDAAALAWLMAKEANQQVIAEHKEPGLSPQLQDLLVIALEAIEVESIRGHQLGWVQLETPAFVPGLSGLAERLVALLGLDTLLFGSIYRRTKAVVIGRSRTNPLLPNSSVDLRTIFEPLGGGGHAQAASVILHAKITEQALDPPLEVVPLEEALEGTLESDTGQNRSLTALFHQMVEAVRSQLPHPITAKSLMSSPVRTILPTTTIDEAQRTLLRYGHVGLCVVNAEGTLVGMISRRDIDIALRHGLGHGPVKGYMSVQIKSITPEAPITDIQSLMMTYDIGRLPVLKAGKLVGIVTRTDLLRQLHQTQQQRAQGQNQGQDQRQPQSQLQNQRHERVDRLTRTYPPSAITLYQQLESRLSAIWPALKLIADIADRQDWALYVVGGAVRDLLLGILGEPYPLNDIDLVVEGANDSAGVALAKAIQSSYPQVTVQIHGQFQTASLVWHPETESPGIGTSDVETWQGSEPLLIDIATARTEFYPYPAANPEVESSTIRQDLYRRDFTINAMALKLNGLWPGQLLDFFGGWIDLQQRHVRVLHANSFIEDPTRIFRAVKFAVRLGFSIDDQSEQFIRYAISSGIYAQMQASENKTPALQTRLKAELKYLLSADHWAAALVHIERLGAWACLHPSLEMTPILWKQLRRMDRWLNKFGLNEPRWLMLLELIIAQLDPLLRTHIAANLNLSAHSLHRLKNLHQWESTLVSQLPNARRPSQIYSLLHPYACPELLLMGDRYPYTLGPQIWQYVVRLSRMPPLINGGTLKQLGYKPGPQFRNILTAVHCATLDGELTTIQAAEAYVLDHYPLP